MEAVLDERQWTRGDGRVEEALEIFVEAVEITADLEITGLTEDMEAFVIRNHAVDIGVEGAYVEVAIKEIVGANGRSPLQAAQQIIRVIQNERKPIVLNGVTRIVGYYSRVTNWNKSKIGELRDRAGGNYSLTGAMPEYQAARLSAINSL